MLGMKRRHEPRPLCVGHRRERDRQLVGLADIAHIDPPLDLLPLRRHAVRLQQPARLADHRRDDCLRVAGREVAMRGEPGLHQIVPQIGDQHAERTQNAGGRRHQEARD